MPLSVSSAEAGLLAAPWEGAAQDPVLEQAARSFYAQTADLTQHGKKDHPTDRIVLDDVAATLALELGAEAPGAREASKSEYVKLPGSGDGFTITVYADGHEDLKRRAHGPEGQTTAPGADAVLAQYGGLIGHAPSQDELAGFLAARVAGGALPGAAGPGGAAGGAGASTVLTVTGSDGSVLATGTAASLLGQWAALVAANNAVTPNIDVPGEPSGRLTLLNATEGAAFLLGLAVQGRPGGAGGAGSAIRADAAAPGLVASYNQSVAWFATIDQPMLAVAAHYAALARYDAGNADRVKLDQTAAALALRIAAEPEGQRGSLSETVQLGGHKTQVTVSQTTTDVTGGAQFHDLDETDIGALFEQVVGVVADVLSFVPVVDVVAIPVAIAVSAAEGAQSLADGDVLGGVLSLAGAAAGGAGAWAQGIAAGAEAGSAAAQAASDVVDVAKGVSRGVAGLQGLRGVVSAAESGDALAALTSAAGGLAGSVFAGTEMGQALAVGSALTGAGVAAAGGDWMRALAATETAAAGAGLFSGLSGTSNSDAAGTASQGAAATAPALAGAATVATAAQAVAQSATQAAVGGTGGALGGGTVAAGDSAGQQVEQQQADARQGEAVQAQQQAGLRQAAQEASLPATEASLPVPPVPPADGPGTPAGDGPVGTPGGSRAPLPSYPMVAPHPVPDGSGAWTNLSDADYAAFKAGQPGPAVPLGQAEPYAPDAPQSAPAGQDGPDGTTVRLGPVALAGVTSPAPMQDGTGAPALASATGALPGSAPGSPQASSGIGVAPATLAGGTVTLGVGTTMALGGSAAGEAGGGLTAGQVALRGLAMLGDGMVGTVVFPAALLGGLFWPSSTASDDTMPGDGLQPGPNAVPAGPGSPANAPVNLGPVALGTGSAMAGPDAGLGALTGDPGLIPPPPLAPLPGYPPLSPEDSRLLGQPETLPIDPNAAQPHVESFPIADPTPIVLPGATIGGQYLPDVWATASTPQSITSPNSAAGSGGSATPVSYDIDTTAMSPAERAAVVEYAQRSNAWLATNGPVTVQPTAGTLRSQASATARSERLAAAQAGQPYQGQAGHVPDTALTGLANPPAGWLDMPGKSNNAVGGALSSRIGKLIDIIKVDGKIP